MKNFHRFWVGLFCLFCLFTAGCGTGLVVFDPEGEAQVLSNVLRLSGATSIRMNDCYQVDIDITDSDGNAITSQTATAALSTSTGSKIYSSLQGCQLYDSGQEVSAASFSPSTPTVSIFVRADQEGAVRIAATSSTQGLDSGETTLTATESKFNQGTGPSGQVRRIVYQSDGSAYVAGAISGFGGTYVANIVRLLADGTIDETFLPTGTGLTGGQIEAVAVQPDGKVLVGGSFTGYNGTTVNRIARLNTDGSLDTSFSTTGTGFNNTIQAIGIQSDGRIIVGGQFLLYNGASQNYIARVNSNGSLDATFAAATTEFNGLVWALEVLSDDKIIVGGGFTQFNGVGRRYVARLNSNGSLDAGLVQTGTGLDGTVYTLAVQSTGEIVVGGSFTSYNGTSRNFIARLTSAGALDTSFAPAGTSLNQMVVSLDLDSLGKVVVGGYFTSYNGTSRQGVARLNSDGTLDTTLALSGTGFGAPFSSTGVEFVAVRADDTILVGGNFLSYNSLPCNRLTLLASDGTLASDFPTFHSNASYFVWNTAVQADGKTLVVGEYTHFDGYSRSRIVRLNTDGTLDSSFSLTGTGVSSTVYCVAVQPDGKILIGGSFTTYNGTSRRYIARLNSDGSLDPSFAQTGTGLSSIVWDMRILGDGKILVVGFFTSYNGTSRPYIARLNSDGTLDSTFAQTGTGLASSVYAIAVQSDDKILVAGDFATYNGSARGRIARLNSDGTLDTSFSPTGTGFNSTVYSVALQDDGKVVVGGNFITFNGTSRRYVARLNADGTLDTSFVHTGTGFNGTVQSIALHSNERVVAGGSFTSYNGTARGGIARLNTDGSLDTDFVPTTPGFEDDVWSVKVQDDSKILAGGYFGAFAGSAVHYVARLLYSGGID